MSLTAQTTQSTQTAQPTGSLRTEPVPSSRTEQPDESARTHRLETREVSLGYGGERIVHEVTLTVPDQAVTVVIGPNGCGKSTLLRGMARLLKPTAGEILLDGADVTRTPTREVARQLALLPQSPVPPEGVTVTELVSRGRHPHHGRIPRWTAYDDQVVAEALERTRTLELAERRVDELSGGQRQRVWLAMALAQDTGLLLLDEPTTYLDLAHQIEMLDLLAEINRTRRTTVVMVLHDLNLAARYADHLVAMRAGRVYCQGSPHEVVTAECMSEVFGLRCAVISDPHTGTPMVVPGGPR